MAHEFYDPEIGHAAEVAESLAAKAQVYFNANIDPATNITATSATLNGSIYATSDGGTWTFYLQKVVGGSGYEAVGSGSWGSWPYAAGVSVSVTGLTPNIEYEFYLGAVGLREESADSGTETFSTASRGNFLPLMGASMMRQVRGLWAFPKKLILPDLVVPKLIPA
jgi:hypothetical protein